MVEEKLLARENRPRQILERASPGWTAGRRRLLQRVAERAALVVGWKTAQGRQVEALDGRPVVDSRRQQRRDEALRRRQLAVDRVAVDHVQRLGDAGLLLPLRIGRGHARRPAERRQ